MHVCIHMCITQQRHSLAGLVFTPSITEISYGVLVSLPDEDFLSSVLRQCSAGIRLACKNPTPSVFEDFDGLECPVVIH